MALNSGSATPHRNTKALTRKLQVTVRFSRYCSHQRPYFHSFWFPFSFSTAFSCPLLTPFLRPSQLHCASSLLFPLLLLCWTHWSRQLKMPRFRGIFLPPTPSILDAPLFLLLPPNYSDYFQVSPQLLPSCQAQTSAWNPVHSKQLSAKSLLVHFWPHLTTHTLCPNTATCSLPRKTTPLPWWQPLPTVTTFQYFHVEPRAVPTTPPGWGWGEALAFWPRRCEESQTDPSPWAPPSAFPPGILQAAAGTEEEARAGRAQRQETAGRRTQAPGPSSRRPPASAAGRVAARLRPAAGLAEAAPFGAVTPAALEHLEGWRRCLRLGPALPSAPRPRARWVRRREPHRAPHWDLPGKRVPPAAAGGGQPRGRGWVPPPLAARPPEGGKEAARQPGLRRWCPPGLKSARRKMASSPSLLPGGYLAMIIAFIRFCLPSSRTSSLARCPLGAGRMGRKTAASPPWFPASLPGCQVKIRAAHHRDPRAVPLVRVRCTLGISSCWHWNNSNRILLIQSFYFVWSR